jgi:hypothetical protein
MRTNILLFLFIFYTLAMVLVGFIYEKDFSTMVWIHFGLFVVSTSFFIYRIFKA